MTISITTHIKNGLVEVDVTNVEGESTKNVGDIGSFGNISNIYAPISNKTLLITNAFCSEFRKITINKLGGVFMFHSRQDDFSETNGDWQGTVSGSTAYYK